MLRRAVQTYLDHLSVERGLSRNTLASYRRDLDRYLESLTAAGITDLAAVTAADLTRHLGQLREGSEEHPALSAASAARAVSAVRGLHRFAAREGLAPHDVSRDVKPPAPPKRLPKALDVDQVTRLLDAVTGDEPLALRDLVAARDDAGDDRIVRRGAAQFDAAQAEPEAEQVCVRVDHAGDHRRAVEIADLGLGAAQRQRLALAADEDDAPGAHREGLHLRSGRIDGVDAGVMHDQIGRRFRRRCTRGEDEGQQRQDAHAADSSRRPM